MRTLLYLLLPIFFYAQDSLSINTYSDKLISLAYKDYTKQVRKNSYEYSIYYRKDSVTSVSFHHHVGFVNQNKDLGIAGEPVYRLKKIWGSFLDLAPIWDYFRNKAGLAAMEENDKVELTRTKFISFDFSNTRYIFIKDRNIWQIELLKL